MNAANKFLRNNSTTSQASFLPGWHERPAGSFQAYDGIFSWGKSEEEKELILVLGMVQEDSTESDQEAIMNVARLDYYLHAGGWKHRPLEWTKEAFNYYIDRNKPLSEMWNVKLADNKPPSITNWKNIDKYIDARGWLYDPSRRQKYVAWYKKFNNRQKALQSEVKKLKKEIGLHDNLRNVDNNELNNSDTTLLGITKKAAMPVIAIIIVAGVLITIIYNELKRRKKQ